MTTPIDRLELLRLVAAIAEQGSISAAARALGLSQPSASRQLRQLEAMLGVELVRRSTHALRLTEAGRLVAAEGRRLGEEWQALADRLGEGRAALKGRLRLVVPAGLGQTVLVTVAGRFCREHPLVELEWRLDDTGDLVTADADLWVRVGPIADESLIVRRFGTIERWLVAAPERAAGPVLDDLAGRPAVVLRPYIGAELWLRDASGARLALRPRGSFVTDSLFAAAAAVREGIGYAALPRWLVGEDVVAGRLVRLCPDWRPDDLDLSVAYPPTRHRPARVAAFLEVLRRELPRVTQGILMEA